MDFSSPTSEQDVNKDGHISSATLLLVFCWCKAIFCMIMTLLMAHSYSNLCMKCSWMYLDKILWCLLSWRGWLSGTKPLGVMWSSGRNFAILLDIQNVLWYTVNHKLIEIEQKIPLYHQLMTSKAILNCVLCFVGLHVSWNLVWPTSADNIKKLIYGQKLTQFDLKMQYNTVLSELKWLALQLCPKFGGLVWKRTLRKPISRIRLLWRITKRDKIQEFWTFLIVTLLFWYNLWNTVQIMLKSWKKLGKKPILSLDLGFSLLFCTFPGNAFPGVFKGLRGHFSGLERASLMKFSGKVSYTIWQRTYEKFF